MMDETARSLHEQYLLQSALEADEMVHFPCEEKTVEPVYYLKCTHAWSVFNETPQFPYCVNHVCGYMRRIDAGTQAEADRAAAEANAAGFVCPECGTKSRLKGATQFEIFTDRRILESINRSELMHD